MSLIFETIFKPHHCVFRFTCHCTYKLWHKDSFLWNKHIRNPCLDMRLKVEAHMQSSDTDQGLQVTYSGRLKVSSWDFHQQLLDTAGLSPIKFGSILWKCSGGTSAMGRIRRTAKTTVSTFLSTKTLVIKSSSERLNARFQVTSIQFLVKLIWCSPLLRMIWSYKKMLQ